MTRSEFEGELKEVSEAQEEEGCLNRQDVEDKLMNSVLEHDDKTIDDGKLISDVINHGFSSFTPDMAFDSLSKDYAMAKNIFGESLLRLISGYSSSYIKKNIKIPEFRAELKKRLEEKSKEMVEEGYISKQGELTKKAYSLASLVLYTEELDNLLPRGIFGEKVHKKKSQAGANDSVRGYRKGDRYRDISIKKTIRQAIRRGRNKLSKEDIRIIEKKSKGSIYITYAMDASGSMKGKKIEAAKKAGIALAYKAIDEKDHVGLLVFGTEIKERLMPTLNFREILEKITAVRASRETNIAKTIRASIDMFPKKDVTKHLILLTDAMPTIGKNPKHEALEAVSLARDAGVTVSVIGIGLEERGQDLSEKITQIGGGKLYIIKNIENLDKIILQDYYSII